MCITHAPSTRFSPFLPWMLWQDSQDVKDKIQGIRTTKAGQCRSMTVAFFDMFLRSWTRFVRDLRAEVVRDPPSHKNVVFDLCCFVPFHEKHGHKSGSLQSQGISQLIAFLGQEHLIPVSILRSPYHRFVPPIKRSTPDYQGRLAKPP